MAMAVFPNCAETFGKGWRVTLLLLLATVFEQGHSQITCNIEIDSRLGLWRDITRKATQYCKNYKYRETSLRCTAANCQWASHINGSCTVFYNAETNLPCLATCNEHCTHEFKCHGNGYCPCTKDIARYKEAKMCVPYSDVKKCTSKYNIGNQCFAPLCTDTCPNGWCDKIGFCTCKGGFHRDWKTGMCVPNDCTQACVRGTCHTYGSCTCQDGRVVDPREGYRCPTKEVTYEGRMQTYDPCAGITCDNGKCYQGGCKCNDGFRADTNNGWGCVPISCAGEDSSGFCKRECEQSRCKDHGWCDYKGTCMCNEGFRVDGNDGLNCVKINCPDHAYGDYCQRVCQRSPCKDRGRCVDGACTCNHGFKKSTRNIYQCDQIQCPSRTYETNSHCKGQCDKRCNNGYCDYSGTCTCNLGYKKSRNNIYQCDQIQCPAKVGEDINFCKTQCDGSCNNGQCDNDGTCTCNSGYKKATQSFYQCDKIQCPSKTEEDDTYCKTQCYQLCHDGWCGNNGTCSCNEGFKKSPITSYQCDQIICPSWTKEDNDYCKAQCNGLCKNGQCGYAGICTCSEGFKKSPNTLYQCDRIVCPSVGKNDVKYCDKQCSQLCHNGTCSSGGACNCNVGFKRMDNTLYSCDQINCPSTVLEDNAFCVTKCQTFCTNGTCDNLGRCACKAGFTKDPNGKYTCVIITCPATVKNDRGFCKSVCESQCDKGVCDEAGICTCNEGFKKLDGKSYECSKINCPSSATEDNVYCKSQCGNTCENGKCNDIGACLCDENFVPVNWTMRVNCHHECNEDESCPLAAILGGIVGVGFVIVIAIIVTAALLIRKRNRKEREEREQGVTQNIPLETLHEGPEYNNHEQEEEMEVNIMYRSVAWHTSRHRV